MPFACKKHVTRKDIENMKAWLQDNKNYNQKSMYRYCDVRSQEQQKDNAEITSRGSHDCQMKVKSTDENTLKKIPKTNTKTT